MPLSLERRVTLGEVINFVLLIALALGGYFQLKDRVDSMEMNLAKARETADSAQLLLQRTNKILDRMELTLENFPPHRHVGRDIVYPNGSIEKPDPPKVKP